VRRGVDVAFGVPMGGVIASLEDVSSFFPAKVYLCPRLLVIDLF